MTAMTNDEKLIYMINQIARNLSAAGDDSAALATCQHIREYWDPRMRLRLLSLLATDVGKLSPVAAAAASLYAEAVRRSGIERSGPSVSAGHGCSGAGPAVA